MKPIPSLLILLTASLTLLQSCAMPEPIRPGVLPSAENNYNGEMGFTKAPADATRDVSLMCNDKGGLASGPSFMLESRGMKYFSYRCKGPSYAVNLAETVITTPFFSNSLLKDAANSARNVASLGLSSKDANARAVGAAGVSSAARSAENVAALDLSAKATPTEPSQTPVQTQLDEDRRKLAEERSKLEGEKAQREQAKLASRISIQATATRPDANGDFTITISTGADTASLKIDGEELGGRRDGNYVIKRVARVGEDNSYKITARDVFGNTDLATVTVARQVADSRPAIPRLNPANVRVQQSRDAVAIIIGIENYRRVAKADFANADAKEFYTYASRALGIKPENIKLLVDDGADLSDVLDAFQNWLPLKVNKGKTDVYVFYSGHGYPSLDGKGLYFLPFNVDSKILDRTSVKQIEVVAALQRAQAKSVTMFIDACYSGQTRNGEVLVAGIKPVFIKADDKAYPPEFTVITASAADQFSSASPDLKHGIFSFYLMKALEGDADENNDGRLTSGELQRYLSEMVGRQAMGLNRVQNTQLFGNADRVLMTR